MGETERTEPKEEENKMNEGGIDGQFGVASGFEGLSVENLLDQITDFMKEDEMKQ